MMAFMDETGEWVRTGPDVIANRTRYIINDFRTHPDYKDRPYVTGYPHFTSYLEVPLVSPLGYLLGSYCVVDSKQNNFDKDELVETMNEIAATIMAHLENVRIKQSRDRSEQLIQGLSGFIRQVSPIGPGPTLGVVAPEGTESALDPHDPTASSKPYQDGPADTASSHDLEVFDQRPRMASLLSQESTMSALSLASPHQGRSETPPTTPRDDLGDNPMEQQLQAAVAQAAAEATAPRSPSALSESSEPHGFIGSANIKTTFFRAAATMRRSMDMDGLMFLDAVPSSYLDRPDETSLNSREPPLSQAEGPFCAAIVKSVAGRGAETVTHSTHIPLPEASLQRFIRAYPNGHVFTADELGPIDDSYGVGKYFKSRRKADREGLRLQNDIAALFRMLPAAKYVIFLPLWHFQRECWYAATLGWVEDPTRALNIGDVGLVSAFGNSVMAEVSRLEALAASRAKSDFVSSLSHELRSPLHGIMASSELVREGISDRPLLSTLDMLDSCATTLLDTFNNLLDHAVVTHSGQSGSSGAPAISEIQDIDLGILVEDVVDVVQVGHLSGNALQMQASPTRHKLANAEQGFPGNPILITVQIARRPWKLPFNVGAWKRIVMNIFGNAIKYTSAGRIEVGLRVVKRTDKAGNASDYVSFTVKDTGAGMSSDYIKYRLFTPFSQEDSHAPGMGLGLSIVRQLVSDLGGIVNIKSSLGIGTLVEVLVPFGEHTPAVTDQHAANQEISELHGRTVCFVAADACAAVPGAEFGVGDKARDWSEIVEKSIRANAGAFLGMQVLVATKDCPVPSADVYVLDSSMFAHETKECRDRILQAWRTRATPLVVLCSGSASCFKQQLTNGYDHGLHLHHPIGPRKLAAVFRSALRARFDNTVNAQVEDRVRAIPDSLSDQAALALRSKGGQASPPPDAPLLSIPPPNTPSENANKPSLTEMVSSQPPTNTTHLLLVDDNPINLKLLTQLVRKLKHTFATANNGLEAVQLYKKSLEGQASRFDLIFMDISMPVMNGFEATREIRQLEIAVGAGRCKIVALTGLRSDVNGAEATASGLDLFLTKPVKLNTIRQLLDEMRAGSEG
jgi:signal transduction histidine kinase/ActR/RegA family two-component response regulator